MSCHRVFLGWEPAPLQRAAAWILAELGHELSGVAIVAPGRRAGRNLLALLVSGAPPDVAFAPPRVLTPHELPELLYRPREPAASRSTRLLAWLAAIDDGNLQLGRDGGDFGSRLGAAAALCRLQDELGGEGLSIGAVAAEDLDGRDAARWQEAARLEAVYRQTLAGWGVGERNAMRRDALAAGEIGGAEWTVVLCGVAEPGRLVCRLLDASACRQYALVLAPEALAAGFDAWGGVRRAAWLARLDESLGLALEIEGRDGAVAVAASRLVRTAERAGAGTVAIGVPGSRAEHGLRRGLERAGLTVRSGVGRAVTATEAWEVLRDLAELVATRRVDALTTVLRHPAVESWLAARMRGRTTEVVGMGVVGQAIERGDWLSAVDGYLEATCLRSLPLEWPGPEGAATVVAALVDE
ncbi:MAG: hypothetical protein R3190_18075, partial [Thermoanaerobaculia bacterium]|nr:hypothetical protein [Thermoanaerobaculia bacterium]